MDSNEVKVIYARIFDRISLWASPSFHRSVITILIFLIFGIPLIAYLQNLVAQIKYFSLLVWIVAFLISTFNIVVYLILFAFLIVASVLYWTLRQIRKTKVITDDFNENLNLWAIPLGASWTIQKCEGRLGKMLSVTASEYPATLKGAYWWYDYEVEFETKIKKNASRKSENFSVVIRSESNFNGIMLQFTKTHLRPHFIYNGTFIIDNNAVQQLPTILDLDNWIKVKVVVKGNDVQIFINDYPLQYKIPTKVFNNVANELLYKGLVSLQDIEDSNREIDSKLSKIRDIESMPASPAKDAALPLIEPIRSTIPVNSKIILEYQKGSVGFRESGKERACFRSFKIKKI